MYQAIKLFGSGFSMGDNKVVLSKNVTPTTKRIGVGCIAFIAALAVAGSSFGEFPTEDAVLITVTVITAIAALLDGGK